jgi:hypothetical protein
VITATGGLSVREEPFPRARAARNHDAEVPSLLGKTGTTV